MLYYCCANEINIGDYFSMLGAKLAIGLCGKEEFMELRAKPFSDFLSLLNDEDTIIIGGGGLFKDYFRRFWIEILDYKKINNFDIILFGVGICDHKNKKNSTVLEKSMIEKIISNSKINFIRHPFDSIGMPVYFTYCPSMYFVSNNFLCYANKKQNKLLYVSHKDLIGKNKDEEIRKHLQKFCIQNNMGYSEVDNIIRENNGINDIMDLYQNSEIVVSTRLHGYIIAKTLGKKVVAISNDHKIEGFANAIGDVKPLDCENLDKKTLSDAIKTATIMPQDDLSNFVKEIKIKGSIISDYLSKK